MRDYQLAVQEAPDALAEVGEEVLAWHEMLYSVEDLRKVWNAQKAVWLESRSIYAAALMVEAERVAPLMERGEFGKSWAEIHAPHWLVAA